MFGYRVRFLRSADRMALFRVGPNSIGMWEKTMRTESQSNEGSQITSCSQFYFIGPTVYLLDEYSLQTAMVLDHCGLSID